MSVIDALNTFAQNIENPQEKRLFLLAAAGLHGPHSWNITQDFRYLGILHLLVLSGSQISHFRAVIDRLFGFLAYRKASPLYPYIRFLGLSTGLLFIGHAFTWPAPITRAIICEIFRAIFPHFRLDLALFFCLLIQAILFSHQLQQWSFFLSWFAYLTLQLAPQLGLKKELIKSLFTTLITQIVCLFLFSDQSSTNWPVQIAWGLVANLIMGIIFEFALMPIIGWIWLWAIAGISPPGAVFLADAMSAVCRVILVVTNGFMYIID